MLSATRKHAPAVNAATCQRVAKEPMHQLLVDSITNPLAKRKHAPVARGNTPPHTARQLPVPLSPAAGETGCVARGGSGPALSVRVRSTPPPQVCRSSTTTSSCDKNASKMEAKLSLQLFRQGSKGAARVRPAGSLIIAFIVCHFAQ